MISFTFIHECIYNTIRPSIAPSSIDRLIFGKLSFVASPVEVSGSQSSDIPSAFRLGRSLPDGSDSGHCALRLSVSVSRTLARGPPVEGGRALISISVFDRGRSMRVERVSFRLI